MMTPVSRGDVNSRSRAPTYQVSARERTPLRQKFDAGAPQRTAAAAGFIDFDDAGDFFGKSGNMADDANQFSATAQVIQSVESGFQSFGIEGSETFIEKERIHPDFFASHLRKSQSQSQRYQKAFAAGKGLAAPDLIALIFISDVDAEFFILTAEQLVAAAEFFQFQIGKYEQMFKDSRQ